MTWFHACCASSFETTFVYIVIEFGSDERIIIMGYSPSSICIKVSGMCVVDVTSISFEFYVFLSCLFLCGGGVHCTHG